MPGEEEIAVSSAGSTHKRPIQSDRVCGNGFRDLLFGKPLDPGDGSDRQRQIRGLVADRGFGAEHRAVGFNQQTGQRQVLDELLLLARADHRWRYGEEVAGLDRRQRGRGLAVEGVQLDAGGAGLSSSKATACLPAERECTFRGRSRSFERRMNPVKISRCTSRSFSSLTTQ